MKNLIIAGVAFAAALTSEAHAEGCKATWVNTRDVAESLFTVPANQWNKPLIASWGAENVDKIIRATDGWQNRLMMRSDNIFRRLDALDAKKTAINWDSMIQQSPDVLHPVFEKMKAGKLTIAEGKTASSAAIVHYVSSATTTLAGIKAQPVPCLVLQK